MGENAPTRILGFVSAAAVRFSSATAIRFCSGLYDGWKAKPLSRAVLR
jgi:hypothetical protein